MKVKELRELFIQQIVCDVALQKSTKRYYKECVSYFTRLWPELDGMAVAEVTRFDCAAFGAKLPALYSPVRANGIIQRLNAMFRLAVELGVIEQNPAYSMRRIPVKIRPPTLPDAATFNRLLVEMDRYPIARNGAEMVRFLAYSGLRIGEARKLTAADITEHGIRVADAKNGETNYVPIIPELKELLEKLPQSGPLFRIKNPRRTLQAACRRLGIPELTNHHLRHMFATRCIECAVDIKTVSSWLRHKDGGALAMRYYAHVRNEHSKEMAAKVSFEIKTAA